MQVPPMTDLIQIGFWRDEIVRECDFVSMRNIITEIFDKRPDPRRWVFSDWDPIERTLVVNYLESKRVHQTYFGMAECRMCKDNGIRKEIGCREYTDGTYVWPEGFSHYLREHAVKPPSEFVLHVTKSSGGKP